MRHITNTFTIIFVLAAFASMFQLGSLGKGITASFADSLSVNALTITPTAQPVNAPQQHAAFEPERIVIASINTDLLIFSEAMTDTSVKTLPHAVSHADNTGLVNDKEGNVVLVVDTKLIGLDQITKLSNDMEVVVLGDNKKATYKVVSEGAVATNEDVFAKTAKPSLTIVTADGDLTKKQYIVKAELVKIEDNK